MQEFWETLFLASILGYATVLWLSSILLYEADTGKIKWKDCWITIFLLFVINSVVTFVSAHFGGII